eukprot:220429-Rhodomonas_salina.1
MSGTRFYDWKRIKNDAMDLMNMHVNLQPSVGLVRGSPPPLLSPTHQLLILVTPLFLLRIVVLVRARAFFAGCSETMGCAQQQTHLSRTNPTSGADKADDVPGRPGVHFVKLEGNVQMTFQGSGRTPPPACCSFRCGFGSLSGAPSFGSDLGSAAAQDAGSR